MSPTGGQIPDHRWRVVHSIGMAFLIGAPCGGAFHFVRGALRASPPHVLRRLAAGAQAARAHAPRLAGWYGAYSGLWCAFEGAASLARGNKEDPWNSVAAGAATWALLDAGQGIRVAARSAVLGTCFGAVIEGALIVCVRAFVEGPRWREPPPVPPKECPAVQPPAGHAPTSGGFLGIPRQHIVVQEIAVDDLPSFWRHLN